MDLADRVGREPARFSAFWGGGDGRASRPQGDGAACAVRAGRGGVREDQGVSRLGRERPTEDALVGGGCDSGSAHGGGPRAEVGAERPTGGLAGNCAHMGVAHFGQGRGGKGGRVGLSAGGRGSACVKASCAWSNRRALRLEL